MYKLAFHLAMLLMLMGLSPMSYAITLKEAIEDAIIHNPQFREQVKAYRANEAELSAAENRYLPQIDLNLGLGYEEVKSTLVDTTNGNGLMRREASIRVTENLFEGYATSKEILRQKYLKDAQAFKIIAVANDVAINMTEAFISLLKHQELLKLSKDNLDTHRKLLEQITKRSEAGIGNQVEVDQARARYALAQSNYASEQNSYFDSEAKYRRTLGRNPDNDLVKPRFTYELPKDLTEVTNIALLDHPTLRSASADIAESRLQYEASSSLYFPRVDLEIQKTFDKNLGGYKGPNENLQAMVRLKWNLYNGGKDLANRERTAANYHQATEIRNNTRRQIIENLRYAWNAHTFISEQLTYIDQHIQLTQETLAGYRKQFNLGRRSLLDLLNTENEYVSALKTLINSEYDALNAKYNILGSMGHLLPTMDIQYNFITTTDHNNE